MKLALLFALATTCTPSDELDVQRAAACRLTGGSPDVVTFARCTTKPASCVWTNTYRSCTR